MLILTFCIQFFVSHYVYSDTSGTGYSGCLVENPKNIAHGMCHEYDVHHSSTWKELTTVKWIWLLWQILWEIKLKRLMVYG